MFEANKIEMRVQEQQQQPKKTLLAAVRYHSLN